MWLRDSIIEGLQTLLVLRLNGTPAVDTITAVAEVWIAVFNNQHIKWNQQQDADRIREGFLKAAGTLKDWPAPCQVLSCLPARPKAQQDAAEVKCLGMPPAIKKQFQTILDDPKNQVKRGSVKAAYSIHFYRHPDDPNQAYYQIVFNDKASTPEAPIDQLIEQADSWLCQRATPVGGLYQRPKAKESVDEPEAHY
ncbi:hypothetical protein JCM14076_06250 [Methylosoma difficile]